MPTTVRCDDCGKKFSIGDRELSGSCPACGTPKRKPKSAKTSGKKSASLNCPSCKTRLPENTSYCARCGVEIVDPAERLVKVLQDADDRIHNARWWTRILYLNRIFWWFR